MSESSPLLLDESELEEARSLVLLGFPAAVPPTRPMVVELGGLVHFWSQFGCVSVALSGAGSGPCLNFWGPGVGPLRVMVR